MVQHAWIIATMALLIVCNTQAAPWAPAAPNAARDIFAKTRGRGRRQSATGMGMDTGMDGSTTPSPQCGHRPITDFTNAQGSTSGTWWCGTGGGGGNDCPPDLIGWTVPTYTNFVLADYAGVIDNYLGGSLGTVISGTILETPRCTEGTGRACPQEVRGGVNVSIQVALSNTFFEVHPWSTFPDPHPWANGQPMTSGDWAPSLGATAYDIKYNGATPLVGNLVLSFSYLAENCGDPIPDFQASGWNVGPPHFNMQLVGNARNDLGTVHVEQYNLPMCNDEYNSCNGDVVDVAIFPPN